MVTLRWRGNFSVFVLLICAPESHCPWLSNEFSWLFLSQITELWHIQWCTCAFAHWAPPTICLLLFYTLPPFYPSFLLCLSFSAGSVDVREKGKPHACSARWCLLRYPRFTCMHAHTHTHWYYCVTWWARQCSVIFALSLRCPLVLFYFFIAHTQSLIGVCSWSIDNRVKQFTLLVVSREKNDMIPADTGGFFKKRMTHRRKRASSQEFISVYITCECRPGQGASGQKAKLFF